MSDITKLKKCVTNGLKWLKQQKELKEAEVFAAINGRFVTRIDFKSHIECNAIQEPKSDSSFGVSVRISFERNGQLFSSQGSEDRNLTLKGVQLAYAKAIKTAVANPLYRSLAKPSKEKPSLEKYHDEKLIDPDGKTLMDLPKRVLLGALNEFKKQGFSSSDNIIIGGDVTFLNEQMAVGNTHGIFESDISTPIMTMITAMIEKKNAKGTGWSSAANSHNFDAEGAGRMAVQSAISTIGGEKIPSGKYNVVLGPQATATIVSNLMSSEFDLGSHNEKFASFCDKLGKPVISDQLSIFDHGAMPGAMASKRVTCEGLPTGKTDLVKNGKLIGLLASSYSVNSPENKTDITEARNGFRFGGGGRFHRSGVGTEGTNLVIEGSKPIPSEELIKKVGNGIYIGRLWYLYPINIGSGDFTGTIIGDSYIIKNGKIDKPLMPNKVRLNDNWIRLFKYHILSVSKMSMPTLLWANEELVFAPEIGIWDMNLEEIDILLT